MRRAAIGGLILLAACSKAPERSEQLAVEDAAAPARSAGPGVDVTAAPGVAFTYAYRFRLPAVRIAAAQENHAQACERLGVTRCRITGMRYSLDGGNDVSAALAFKLDPTLARAFGRDGIAAIERAEGMLVDAEITGTDAASEIAKIDGGRAALDEERARIERELARPGAGGAARAELLRQRAALDEQARAAAGAKTAQQESLARTPVTFSYESGRAIRSFDPRSPFAEAADTAITSTQWTLALALGAIALLGPPALLAAALFALWRYARRRWRTRQGDGGTPA